MKFSVCFLIASSLALTSNYLMAQCPNPEYLCGYYHPGSMVTGYCILDDCFTKSHAAAVSVVAADDEGLYPRRWNMWLKDDHETYLTGSFYCSFDRKNKKIKVWIEGPDPALPICRLDLESEVYKFYEHFGSNPSSGCLGWLECTELKY
jgi:hypothetical protein